MILLHISCFFVETFYFFSFASSMFIIAHRNVSMADVLKSLLDNFNMHHFDVVTCLFFFLDRVEIFLVFDIMSDF